MKAAAVIILGANGNCVDIADTVDLLSQRGAPFRLQGFLDDDEAMQGTVVGGYPVLGKLSTVRDFADAHFVCGIGSSRSFRRKAEIIAAVRVPAERWVTVVHPAASVSPSASLGHGTVLLANSSVGGNTRVGNHVMVLQNSVISHDAVIGDYSAIATGVCLSGLVVIGANCYLGSNSAVRERLRVGDRALVGMGAVVTRDVASDTVVSGNPARPR